MNAKEIWNSVLATSQEIVEREPALSGYLAMTILKHSDLFESIALYLADKLEDQYLSSNNLQVLFLEAFENSKELRENILEDLLAFLSRDPAAKDLVNIILNYKGFHALQSYRVAHYFWTLGRIELAQLFQSLISEKYGVDIHPGATIGKGTFIDHVTGLVVGETTVIGDQVSILQDVTLGGTGKETGDRHPKVGNGVLIGAGAKVLGNIKLGEGSKIGAGSVVLRDVPKHSTVVGVPAQVVGKPREALPSLEMDQNVEET